MSSAKRPVVGARIKGIYLDGGRGTVLDYSGIVNAHATDNPNRFAVKYANGTVAYYSTATRGEYWEQITAHKATTGGEYR